MKMLMRLLVALAFPAALNSQEEIIVVGGTRGSETEFEITITRQETRGNLLVGTIAVNGQVLGDAYENLDLRIPAGTYRGFIRYISGHNFVSGPFGTIGRTGDFLLEVGNVTGYAGEQRTSILFHGGNQPGHSRGCILLGGVPRDRSTGRPYLTDEHPLRQLRQLFYGSDTPNSTPNRRIRITIVDEYTPRTTLP